MQEKPETEKKELKDTALSMFWDVIKSTWDKDKCKDIRSVKSYFIDSVKHQVCKMLLIDEE